MNDINLGGDPAHIATVKERLKSFTQRQIKDTMTAGKFQNTASITTTGIIAVVDKNMLKNSPLTREPIKYILSIWGPSVPNLDSKTTRRRTDHIQSG